MLVAVLELVAVAQRDALGGEERAEERRHPEDLVADQLEEPADLPLGHRAEAQPGHVDQRAQVRGHHQVGPRGIREDEARVLAREAGLEHVAIELERPSSSPAAESAASAAHRCAASINCASTSNFSPSLIRRKLGDPADRLRVHVQIAIRRRDALRRQLRGARGQVLQLRHVALAEQLPLVRPALRPDAVRTRRNCAGAG